ncbi:MAG: hypothetical protein KDC35_08620 [Acidobacteria bacterium]|nr:hypothetical protein [Acidobacteriota bacterium]
MIRWLKNTLGLVALLSVVTVLTSQLSGLNLVFSAVIGAVISILIVLMMDSKSNRDSLNTTLMQLNPPPKDSEVN